MLRRQQDAHQALPEERGARVKPVHASGTQQASGAQQVSSTRQAQGTWQASGMRQAQSAQQASSMHQASNARQSQGTSRKSTGRKKLSKRQRATRVLGVLALLLGLCIFAYPSVSNYLFQQAQGSLIQLQATAVSATSQETLDAMYAAAVEYNERLFDTRTVITDPFDDDTALVTDEEYESLLNLEGNGIMATITIPAIDVQLVIYHGTSDDVLQQGVGHLQGSSLPVGGESTHVVLAGHTGLPNAQIFDDIDQLEVGDYFIITVLGRELAYSITSIEIVLPEETDSLVIQEGEDLVTLVTCTPYGINSHRLLVHAERCEIPDEWLNGDVTISDGLSSLVDRALLPSILIGLALALVIIIVCRLISRLRAHRAAQRAASAGAARFAGEAVLTGEAARSGGGAAVGAGGLAPPHAAGSTSSASSGGRARAVILPEVLPDEYGYGAAAPAAPSAPPSTSSSAPSPSTPPGGYDSGAQESGGGRFHG